mmetsp:Transcript_132057/g.228903  ORF Transcript_132057/g.228903 Transcript_132057/m.228903 type:complete len:259 (+) Transcript_132057:1969-2745(+)
MLLGVLRAVRGYGTAVWEHVGLVDGEAHDQPCTLLDSLSDGRMGRQVGQQLPHGTAFADDHAPRIDDGRDLAASTTHSKQSLLLVMGDNQFDVPHTAVKGLLWSKATGIPLEVDHGPRAEVKANSRRYVGDPQALALCLVLAHTCDLRGQEEDGGDVSAVPRVWKHSLRGEHGFHSLATLHISHIDQRYVHSGVPSAIDVGGADGPNSSTVGPDAIPGVNQHPGCFQVQPLQVGGPPNGQHDLIHLDGEVWLVGCRCT